MDPDGYAPCIPTIFLGFPILGFPTLGFPTLGFSTLGFPGSSLDSEVFASMG